MLNIPRPNPSPRAGNRTNAPFYMTSPLSLEQCGNRIENELTHRYWIDKFVEVVREGVNKYRFTIKEITGRTIVIHIYGTMERRDDGTTYIKGNARIQGILVTTGTFMLLLAFIFLIRVNPYSPGDFAGFAGFIILLASITGYQWYRALKARERLLKHIEQTLLRK